MADNFEGFKAIIDHAMKEGLYYGINLEVGDCHDCGYHGQISDTCPKCQSGNVTGITRCCG